MEWGKNQTILLQKIKETRKKGSDWVNEGQKDITHIEIK